MATQNFLVGPINPFDIRDDSKTVGRVPVHKSPEKVKLVLKSSGKKMLGSGPTSSPGRFSLALGGTGEKLAI